MKTKPKSVEEMVALISLDDPLKNKTQAMVRSHLGAHIQGSNAYKEIAEDAIGESSENFLRILKQQGEDWELYQQALDSYDTSACLTSKYLMTSVRRYITDRKFNWGANTKTGEHRFRARVKQPLNNEGDDNGNEDWLDALVNANSTEQSDFITELDTLIVKLHAADFPSEIIDIVSMRIEGRTFTEIAEALGCSKDAVRMKLTRAKSRIREVLELET